jgi:hypothetical protein
MERELMNGTRAQIVGKFTLYIKPDGSLVAMTGNQHLLVTADEARGLFDYLLQYARYFEQASSNERTGNTEPLRIGQAQQATS